MSCLLEQKYNELYTCQLKKYEEQEIAFKKHKEMLEKELEKELQNEKEMLKREKEILEEYKHTFSILMNERIENKKRSIKI
jgi:hypothetical protein